MSKTTTNPAVDQQVKNPFDDDISTIPSKRGDYDFSKRRRLGHLHDLLNRGRWTAFPNELIEGLRLKIISQREYCVLMAILSLPPSFLLKRSYLEGFCKSNDILKVTQQLVDWGCIQVEEVSDKRGGFLKLHHTRPLSDWTILDEIVDAMNLAGGKVDDVSLGRERQTADVSLGRDLNKIPSSSTGVRLQTKNKTPCHNDDVDLIQASITPSEPVKKQSTSSLGRGDPSPRKAAYLYAESMAFLYSKKKNDTYDYEIANWEAELFLQEFGKKSAQVLLNWAQGAREIHDRVRVEAKMFKTLWACFLRDTDLSDG